MGLDCPLPPFFPGSSHSPILLPPHACLSHVVLPLLTRASSSIFWPQPSLLAPLRGDPFLFPTILVSSLSPARARTCWSNKGTSSPTRSSLLRLSLT